MKNTFRQFWRSLDSEKKKTLASDANTSVQYLHQVSNGHRGAGWATIKSLLSADPQINIDMFE